MHRQWPTAGDVGRAVRGKLFPLVLRWLHHHRSTGSPKVLPSQQTRDPSRTSQAKYSGAFLKKRLHREVYVLKFN